MMSRLEHDDQCEWQHCNQIDFTDLIDLIDQKVYGDGNMGVEDEEPKPKKVKSLKENGKDVEFGTFMYQNGKYVPTYLAKSKSKHKVFECKLLKLKLYLANCYTIVEKG